MKSYEKKRKKEEEEENPLIQIAAPKTFTTMNSHETGIRDSVTHSPKPQ